MNVLHRTSVSAGEGLDFVISDGSLDGHGTRINPNGWDLGLFQKSPVALWAHGRDPRVGSVTIGRWTSVRAEAGKLIGTFVRAARGTGPVVDEICSLIEQGLVRAVSAGFVVLQEGDPKKGEFHFMRQKLREVSFVAVGSNENALSMARSLNVSPETLSLVFGESANERRGTVTNPGKTAAIPSVTTRSKTMSTLSQRITDAQANVVARRDKFNELDSAASRDLDAIEGAEEALANAERELALLERREAREAGKVPAAPAVRRPLGIPQADVKPSDLIVRSGVVHLLAHISGRSVDSILEERYPGHEATAVVTRTAIVPAATTTSGWASQLVETAMAEFLALLPATSVYPVLRSMGIGLTFGPNSGAIKIPFSSTTAALAGGFVLEGDPIPVGRLTLDSTTLTPHKFGIIVPMTKEVMRYTNPAIEAVVRSELLTRTSITLDGLLLDATVGSATRPAGLLYGVSDAASPYGGADYTAFLEDMKALLAPFDTANAGRSLAVLMNPAQARNIRMMPGPNNSGFGWANQFLADFRLVSSTTVPAGTVIAIDTADFVTGTGDSPMFETSDQATIHMESSPAPLSAVASPNTVAAPIRSMFQTNSVALKMVMDVTWAMRRAGMVQKIASVTW